MRREHASCCLWLLCVPVGGGPPARSPHASFARSARSRGPPWPCHRPPAPQPPHPERFPPPDLRAARGLPARSLSAPRASLGASSRSPARPHRPRATLQSGGHDHRHRSHLHLALPLPTGTAATPPIPQPHQPRRQIPHRIRTTPSGLDNSRINKPSTTCAQPQDLTEARQRGDVETNNTTARPQQRTGATGVTSAPEKCTKNTHFSPAKAMAVSTPHRHTRAKATGVSDNRDASLTGTGSATHSH